MASYVVHLTNMSPWNLTTTNALVQKENARQMLMETKVAERSARFTEKRL